MKSKTQLIVPVLMAGGTGTRLWPLSRETYPKQFLALRGEKTLFQQTVLRPADRTRFANPIVVVNDEHRFIAGGQLGEMGVNATIIVELVARNTAPTAAVAALHAQEHDTDALILMMPADHVIQDGAALTDALRAGAHAAKGGRIVLFGIDPTSPATGYGYIRKGAPIDEMVWTVAEFVEKPDAVRAHVTRDGEHLLLRENESIYLPRWAVHRLENPGKLPLNVIEVQPGAYLGEDDIVRLEDVYQRV